MTNAINRIDKIKKHALIGVILANFIVYLTSVGLTCIMIDMRRDLHLSYAAMEWSVTLYAAFAASFITLAGQYGDIFGRKKILSIGLIIYLIACTIMSFGLNFYYVIIGCSLRGIGAGFIASGSLSVLITLSKADETKKASSMWVTAGFAGYIAGCILGGLCAEFINWRMLFWVCLIPLIYSVQAIIKALPIESEAQKRKERNLKRLKKNRIPIWKQVDYLGSALLFIFAITLVIMLSKGHDWGWHSTIITALIYICPISLILILLSQTWIRHPLIEYKYCLNFKFISGLFMKLACYSTIYPLMYFINLYSQSPIGFGKGPFMGSMYLLPLFISISIFIFITKKLMHIFKINRIAVIGLIVLFLGTLSIYHISPNGTYIDLLWRISLTGAGLGICLPTSTVTSLEDIPSSHTGMASGVLSLMIFLGGTISISIGSTLYATEIHNYLASKLLHLTSLQQDSIFTALRGTSAEFMSQLSSFSKANQAHIIESLHHGASSGLNKVGLVCMIFVLVALFFKILYKIKILIKNK